MNRLLRFCYAILFALVVPSVSFAQLVPDFAVSPPAGCKGGTIQFIDATSGGTVSSYSWDFGDSSPLSTLSGPQHIYTSPGVYTVTLVVSDGSSNYTTTKTVTIYADPVVTFTATPVPSNACLPAFYNFTSSVTFPAPAAPGTPTYTWDFSDGTPNGSGANTSHIYTTAGPFSPILTVVNSAGCTGFKQNINYVTPKPKPVVNFTADSIDVCSAPGTVNFTSTSTSIVAITNLTWNFGDGTPNGSGSPVAHTYAAGGSYSVKLKVQDANGCQDSLTKTGYITVYATPPSFTMPSAVCENTVVTFSNTTAGTTGAAWNFGDGVTGTGMITNHTYTVAGTYTVTMETYFGTACTKRLSKTIVINPKPVTTVTYQPDYPCPFNKPRAFVQFTAITTASPATFKWYFHDGSNDTFAVNPSHVFPSNGYKTVSVVTRNSITGCVDSTPIIDIPINALIPEINASPESGCFPLTVNFGLTLYGSLPPPPGPPPPPYPEPAVTWAWEFVDKAPRPTVTSNSATPNFTWIDTGTYAVKVVFTTRNGCIDSAFKYIHVDDSVHPNFRVAPTMVCPKDTVWFTNLTQDSLVQNVTYNWSTGDSSFITPAFTRGFWYRYSKPGVYTVTLIADHQGCVATKKFTNLITVYPTNSEFTFSVDCPPSKTARFRFTGTKTPANTYYWNFGDGSPPLAGTNDTPSHIYANTGTYTVMLATYNSTYGCRDTFYKTVPVIFPTLSFTADKQAICKNETVTFNGLFNGSTAASYAWIIGNNPVTTYSGNPFYQHTFTTGGYHNVKFVTISGYNNNCYDTVSIPNYILVGQPTVAFTATPTIGCVPLLVSFTDASIQAPGVKITARHWYYGEGLPFIGNATSTSHLYMLAGTFTAKIIVFDSLGCRDSMVRNDHIIVRKPVASFFANKTTICTNEDITFSNASSGTTPISHSWNFDDGTTSNSVSPIHRWNVPGKYTIRLIVTDSTPCADTMRLVDYIEVVGPNAGFTMDDTIAVCPPLKVNFTNTSTGAISYLWDLGLGGGQVAITNPVATYGNPGKYRIILTATDATNCSSYDTGYAYVLGYNGAFAYSPTAGCIPMTVTFTPLVSGIPQLTWDFKDGTVAVTTNSGPITHTYTGSGPYRPIVIYSDGPTCNAIDTGLILIRPDKVDANFSTSVPCVGVSFSLSDGSSATYSSPNKWIWRFSPTDSASGASVSHTYNTSGPHSVRLIVSNGSGCKDTIIEDVFINPLPNVDAGPVDTGICPGDTISLIGRGAVTYTWGPDSLVSCIQCQITRVTKAAPPTWYYVVGVDGNGCINKDSIRTFIQIKTTSSVKPGGEICLGETYRLEAAGATSYSWEPTAFLDSPYIPNPLATPITTTTYVVTAKEGTCLERRDSVTVVVHPTPIFDAGPEQWINYGSSTELQPTKDGIARIDWRPDSTLSCWACFNPVAKPSYTTIYFATAYSEFGCVATDSVMVKVRCNGDSVFVPNTFTPNGDGKNDVFFPRGKGITHMTSMRVYNRWGELVFERMNFPINDESLGWDGLFKGKQLPPDVYMYTMSSRCVSGEPLTFKGDITLIR